MFDIFLKRKEVVLDCFTHEPFVYDYAKINYGYKFYPEWFKNTPAINETPDNPRSSGIPKGLTIKQCPGFKDLFKSSIIIPNWVSFSIKLSDNIEKRVEWFSSWENSSCDHHPREQYEKFVSEDFVNLKLMSPWIFKTKQNIKFVWSQPSWNMQESVFDYVILPGVVDFYTQSSVNINLLLKFNEKPKTIFINPLQPLVLLHPMTEKNVVIKHHLVSEWEWKKMHHPFGRMLFSNVDHLSKIFDKKIDRKDFIKNTLKNRKNAKTIADFNYKNGDEE